MCCSKGQTEKVLDASTVLLPWRSPTCSVVTASRCAFADRQFSCELQLHTCSFPASSVRSITQLQTHLICRDWCKAWSTHPHTHIHTQIPTWTSNNEAVSLRNEAQACDCIEGVDGFNTLTCRSNKINMWCKPQTHLSLIYPLRQVLKKTAVSKKRTSTLSTSYIMTWFLRFR